MIKNSFLFLVALVFTSCITTPVKPCPDRVLEICSAPHKIKVSFPRPKLEVAVGSYWDPKNISIRQGIVEELIAHIKNLEWKIKEYEKRIEISRKRLKLTSEKTSE